MVFSNLIFIFAFLPLVLFFYYIAKDNLKNIVLLIASLIFYAWGEPQYVFLMLLSIVLNYLFGLAIAHYHYSPKLSRAVLVLSIIVNIAILGYFKYADFFLDTLNKLLGTKWSVGELPLPIGISFFTFQAMSYVIDVYRNDVKVQKNIFSLALYISLFPQLVAGPIVRYQDIDKQIQSRNVGIGLFNEGIKRFAIGLSKKVLLANGFGSIADTIFGTPTEELGVLTAWMGITAYTLQIYFDFSGYSDMAIGLGKMFGFDFPENFNYPYISKSVSEFWRRWHISLGSWFRDYLYIPLGGNRRGTAITLRNLLIVWTATGFWHGASWTFMAWGFYYGVLISLERLGFLRFISKLWAPLQHLYVLIVVMTGWVFFRADNFSYSFNYLNTMFGFGINTLYDNTFLLFLHDNWFLFLAGIILSTPLPAKLLHTKTANSITLSRSLFEAAIYMTMLILVMIHLVNSTYNPFIYFRF